MDKNQYRRLWLTLASREYHFGPDDPRTIAAARELAEAKAQAAQAEADRLRALADAMPEPGAVAS